MTSRYTDRFIAPPSLAKPDLTYDSCPRSHPRCDSEHVLPSAHAYCVTLSKTGARMCDVTNSSDKRVCLKRERSHSNGIEAL